MRPNFLHRLVVCSLAAGTIWLSSPLRVLAAKDNLEDLLQSKQPGETPAVPPTATGDGSVLWSTVQLIFALGIIIAIIYLLIRLLSSRARGTQGGAFQTFGAHSLTNNRSVHVVSVGDKVYLLGVGENVTLLDTITDQEQIERLRETIEPNVVQAGSNGLQELISRLRPKSKTQAEEIQLTELPFDTALREKINSLKAKRQDGDQEWEEGPER